MAKMHNSANSAISQKYLNVLANLKALTQSEDGVVIKAHEFASEHQVDKRILLILSKELNLLKRDKPTEEQRKAFEGNVGMTSRYVWNYGEKPIDEQLVGKVLHALSDWSKKPKEVTKAIKAKPVGREVMPSAAKKVAKTVFTPGHLAIFNKIEFKGTADVMIDEHTILQRIKRIEFEVDDARSKVILKAFIELYVQKTENGLIAMAEDSLETVEIYRKSFTNRGFILSPRYDDGKKHSAYVIESVNCN